MPNGRPRVTANSDDLLLRVPDSLHRPSLQQGWALTLCGGKAQWRASASKVGNEPEIIRLSTHPICPMNAAGGRRRMLCRDRRYIHRFDIGRSDAKNEPH